MENQEQEIDLRELFYVLLSKLHIIILVAVFGALCAFAVAKFVLPVKYTSSISIFVNAAGENQNTTDGKADNADLTAAKSLAATYIVILEDDIVYDKVSELLVQDYEISDLQKVFNVSYENGEPYISASQIKSLVTIASVNETEVISISATTQNPQLSADICTYIANIAPDLLTRTTHAGSVESIGNAKVPSSPSSPNVKKITLIGMLAGFVIAAAAVVIAHLIDNRINIGEDFKKRFPDVPVLAEIPDVYNLDKGGKK